MEDKTTNYFNKRISMINQPLKKQFFALLPNNKFIHSFAVVLSGSAFSQFLVVLATPLLTHLYAPKDFGFFAVFNSLIAISTSFTSLRYEQAIPVAENEEDAINLIRLCLGLTLLTTIVITTIALPFKEFAFKLLKTEHHHNCFWLFPVGMLCMGLFQVFHLLAIRKKSFSAIALARISQSAVSIAIRITGYAFGSITLLFSYVAGLVISNSLLAKRTLTNFSFKGASTSSISTVLKKYKKFPLFFTWASLFSTISFNIVPVLFTMFFNPAAAGLFAIANRVLSTPIDIISGSVSNVFFSEGAENRASGSLASKAYKLHEHLAFLGVPAFLLVFIIGPELFKWVLGDKWHDAGEIARWLALWLYLNFCCAPFGATLITLEKQKFIFFQALLMLIVRSSVIVTGACLLHSFKLTVITLGLAEALMALVSAACTFIFLTLNIVKLLMIHIKSLSFGIIMMLPVIVAKASDRYLLLSLAATAVILACYYFKRLKVFYC
ncbi:MAG: lipopolysaccharide biosynthesis protein [Endozoicomonadaceae bacterium]|nr:lipopolysaccharide biosynthesis protein [Endozoicomonadaceae bacterium]